MFGLSYETRQISEARYDALHCNKPERINILLAHGNILCNDKSIPLHRGALETAGFDYVALGHLHNRPEISRRIAYSGSPEPLNRGETGAKGYIIGEIKKEGAAPSEMEWEFVPCARREYVPLTLETTVQSTELSLCSELLATMQKRGLQHMYLVILTGTRGREVVWDTGALAGLLNKQGAIVIDISDETVPDFPVEKLRREQQDTLVGRFIERMEETESPELKKLAMQYGLQALLARDERT